TGIQKILSTGNLLSLNNGFLKVPTLQPPSIIRIPWYISQAIPRVMEVFFIPMTQKRGSGLLLHLSRQIFRIQNYLQMMVGKPNCTGDLQTYLPSGCNS